MKQLIKSRWHLCCQLFYASPSQCFSHSHSVPSEFPGCSSHPSEGLAGHCSMPFFKIWITKDNAKHTQLVLKNA